MPKKIEQGEKTNKLDIVRLLTTTGGFKIFNSLVESGLIKKNQLKKPSSAQR